MKKSEILRGRTLFKRIAQSGNRLDGRLFRCSYLLLHQCDEPFQVAFRVPSRNLNAVRRNRLKRLMREAFLAERGNLDSSLAKSNTRLGMTISYKGSKGISVERVSLSQVRSDIGKFVHFITSRL
ncbi:MAG: ribonuclease P protein component [Bacteroidetes bacterium]|nr:ribonuclease P protein component [Bacteroidota bacterium]MCW5894598.1 ribonuclease P protein component [Bacteroidota bacterium]